MNAVAGEVANTYTLLLTHNVVNGKKINNNTRFNPDTTITLITPVAREEV